MQEKIKCKKCGKVAFATDKKGLMRHLRLAHDINPSHLFNKETYFEPADPDSHVDIMSETKKARIKAKNRKWKNWKRGSENGKNPYVSIIYTPMING